MKRIFAFLLIAFSLTMSAKAEVTEINDLCDIQYNYRPIIIDVYASWCSPCKMYSPIFERMAQRYSGRVDFYKVDVDDPDSEDFITRYNINSVPTTVILWDEDGDATFSNHVESGLLREPQLELCIQYAIRYHYMYQQIQGLTYEYY